MKILLNNLDWQVKGEWPYVHYIGVSKKDGVTDWMKATVPGGVHYDLLNANYIEDPYYEMNSLKCEWVENKWWRYKANLFINEEYKGKNLELVFKGIDYKAHFFINGKEVGEHFGMYTPYSINLNNLVEFNKDNLIEVLFENIPFEYDQMGYTSKASTQKSRFNYKWDFSTRMVNIGIWDDVYLNIIDKVSINDYYVKTTCKDNNGIIDLEVALNNNENVKFDIKIDVLFNGQKISGFSESLAVKIYNKQIDIKNIKRWYTNGFGEQSLYEIKISVFIDEILSDEKAFKTGFRDLEYVINDGEDKGQYHFIPKINGQRVYLKGVNLVPFDHMYGNVTRQTYDKYLKMCRFANINVVRIWGGGIIEKDYFYEKCDEYGIMVWQEFVQSSSGLESIPSEIPQFLELLEKSAIQAVKTKRNHICHTFWSGGNELVDGSTGKPCTEKNKNIAMLKEIVTKYDPQKMFVATSPTGENFFLDEKKLGGNYDVHGMWVYEGKEYHYEKYNKSDSILQSEFGCEGLNSLITLEKILSKKNLKPMPMSENMVLRHHGELWCSYERDTQIFGNIKTTSQFVKCSQYIQAEGLRYIVEANRRRQWRNVGSIIWQFNEPWANVSCTSMVDFYKYPKMSYYTLKNSFSNVLVSLRYNKLYFLPNEEMAIECHLSSFNTNISEKVFVCTEFLNSKGQILECFDQETNLPNNNNEKVYSKTLIVSKQPNDIFFVRLRAKDNQNNILSENVYMFGQKEKEPLKGVFKSKGKLKISKTEEGYILKNEGEYALIGIYAQGIEEENECLFSDNFITLFPNESKTIFTTYLSENKNESKIIFDCLNGGL